MGLIGFTLILEIFGVVLNNPNLKRFIIFHKLVNMIGFIVAPVIPFLGYVFTKEWVNRYEKEKIRLDTILLLPLFINTIITLTSCNVNGCFYITSDNMYERGALFFILPCVTYIYLLYNLYFIYKHRKRFTQSEFIIFSLFYIVPAIFSTIQLKYSIYLTTWNSAAIIIVVTYIFLLNDQAYRDSLTGLENRLAYEHYAQNVDCKKHNKLYMVYIDLDDFKSINDEYGHCEGDEAIKAFANLLIESFLKGQNKIMRLGGDEFLVSLKVKHEEKALAYIKNLIENVETYNKGGKPYKLSFSYGMACYTNEYENIYELLKYTDQLMYEQKQAKKNKLQAKVCSTSIKNTNENL